jgi:multidrug efflux pump subunit AcrB
MNISSPFIRRPIATALLMVGLMVGGMVAYPLLPVAALPNVNYPTLQVTAQLPGADPQTMASSVATPLELQFGQIPGLTQMTSSSALGFTQITLQFDLSRAIDGTVSDTLSAINARPLSCRRTCRIHPRSAKSTRPTRRSWCSDLHRTACP